MEKNKQKKIEQDFSDHRQKMHFGHISPACKICFEFIEKLENNTKLNTKKLGIIK